MAARLDPDKITAGNGANSQPQGIGRAQPGPGRPKGSPNKATAELRDLAQNYGAAAIDELARLAGLVRDKRGSITGAAASEAARITALGLLLDRGYGKATQPLANDPENPLSWPTQVEWVFVNPKDQGAAERA